ncbi:Rieske 2Fe-2S domain-containing protein [Rubeoparvulum massiliense]|uniref:Rieske 2Fe-2S domain-containing protein n=1 Tax=Rubeoparvulum massiliense TaxID=1631346 RepID=UPI00065DFE0B|nr:Rieske 2Fe-2S domain-containing protein [Rubeoparvulum massiliense]
MDRRNFFKEMKRGLFETVYEIFEPALEEKLEKVDRVEELLMGRPIKVGPIEHFQNQPKMVYAGGKPYYIYPQGGKLKGVKAICQHCNTLIQWASFRQTFFCPLCQREYTLGSSTEKAEERQLLLEAYHVQEKDGFVYIYIEE